MTSILASALGIVVGLILALTGAGGAILAVPLLVFGLQLTIAQAGPPALLAVALSAAIGAMLGWRSRTLRYRAAASIAAVGVLCSPLGLWAAHRVPNTPLTAIFAVVLGLVALRMFRQARSELVGHPLDQRREPPPCLVDPAAGRLRWTVPCARALASSGAMAGFLSGLLGVGGGFVIVPALRRFTDLDMRSIVPTSLAVIALVSAGGVAAAALSGHVAWEIALPFAAGAIVGMLGGRLVAGRMRGPRLQQAFAITSGAIAVGMLVTALFPLKVLR